MPVSRFSRRVWPTDVACVPEMASSVSTSPTQTDSRTNRPRWRSSDHATTLTSSCRGMLGLETDIYILDRLVVLALEMVCYGYTCEWTVNLI